MFLPLKRQHHLIYLKMPTERLVKQFIDLNSLAHRLIDLSEIDITRAYCYLAGDRLIIGTNYPGCTKIVDNEDRLMAIIRGYRAIPEIAKLKFVQIDIFTLAERRIKFDLLPIESEEGEDSVSIGAVSKEQKDALIRLLALSDEDKRILLEVLEGHDGEGETLLVRMSDHKVIAALADVLIWKTKPEPEQEWATRVKPRLITDRLCTPFWHPQDLADYSKDILQQKTLDNYTWRSRGVDESGDPTSYYLQQQGTVQGLMFAGQPHRLVRIRQSEPIFRGLKKRIYMGNGTWKQPEQ